MARISRIKEDFEVVPNASNVWRAGLYLRLSKEDGDSDDEDKYESDSITNQRLVIEDFLSDNLDILVENIYADDGYSGGNFDRPNFIKMIEDIRIGRINCVIVKDLSRFGRNYLEAGQYLQVFFPVMEVRFIAVIDFIDSFVDNKSINSSLVSFKNVMNEEYCRDISIKIKSTLSIKRENGEYLGSGVYGYKKTIENKNKLIIDENCYSNVQHIFKWYLAGNTIFSIARKLNEMGVQSPSTYKKGTNTLNKSKLWCVQTVRRILENQIYIGDMLQGKTAKISHKINKLKKVKKEQWSIVENTHEPIIDREIFDNVQALLKKDTRVSTRTNQLGLFSGLLKCSDCGASLQKKNKMRKDKTISFSYYICRTYNNLKKDACTNHRIRHDKLEEVVHCIMNKFIRLAVDMNQVIENINQSPKRNTTIAKIKYSIDEKEKEENKIENILLDLYPDLKADLISKEQYLSLKTKYELGLKKIRTALVELRKSYDIEKDGINGSNIFLQTFSKYYPIQILTREVLVKIVDAIIVHQNGEINIKFKFADAYERAIEYINANRELLSSEKIKEIL